MDDRIRVRRGPAGASAAARGLAVVATLAAWATAATAQETGAPAMAAGARTWSTQIHYFNPGERTARFTAEYLNAAGTAVSTDEIPVPPLTGGTLLPGALVPGAFAGSAAVTSDQPLALLYRQQATGAAPTAPMLYPGLPASGGGDGAFFVPAVQRGGGANTLLGIQNLGDQEASVTVDFLSATSSLKKTVSVASLKPFSPAVIDLAKIASLGTLFAGSAVVRAKRVGDNQAAPVAASAELVPLTGKAGFAFNGAPGTSSRLLVPRAMCLTTPTGTLSSVLDVQNSGPASAKFVVSYYYPVVSGGRTTVKKATVATALAAPGRRISIDPCKTTAVRGKQNAVAVVTGQGAGGGPAPVAALVRWVNSGPGIQNALSALTPPGAGADGKYRVVFPAVEWAKSSGARTSIDVMNAAPKAAAASTPIAVTVTYYPRTGAPKTAALAVHTQVTTNPSLAGALSQGSFNGAVVVESTAPIAAAAQVQQLGYTVADGYAGVPW